MRTPFPTFGGSLSSLLQPLRGPSPSFVALRGYLFAFAFSPFVDIFSPLPDPRQPPIDPPPTPSWPFAVLRGPSWTCFCLCLFALRGYFLPPTRPLANPYRSISNPLVALRRSSWPFVDMFLPLPFRPSWTSSPPFPTLGSPLSIPLQPLRGPSPFFVALRGYVFAFSFSPFVDIFLPFPFRPSWKSFCLFLRALPSPSWITLFPFVLFVDPLRGFLFSSCPFVALRGSSCPLVDPFVDNRDDVPSLQAAPGTFPHLC